MKPDILIAALNDHKLKKKLPTPRERDVILYVKNQGFAYSLDTATHFGITQQVAGQLLRSAYRKGYLERVRIPGPSGETVYRYMYALEEDNEQRNNEPHDPAVS